ncbi:hypothetical protein CH333_08030 [candidate division WOR-3 bacterium JGI_Cruoil_03_44_89]|uniref:Transporter n=1 Tax=candidate division WOR-3 bacterium JGI_Cruoil_03_44_89 TaxID=1973748 RepID=A0A235BQE4_UNCW3|nr:MAG: hypothetical protein CH333_08030 [candidate division WOR-3 bacterium JGI_Cruoil_03_44_89]
MALKLHFLFLLCVVILSNNSFAAEPLSLDDCISLARENNATLIRAKTAIEEARAGVTAAYSSYYPSIGLSGGYRNEKGFTGEREDNYSTSIGVQYPIFRGGYVRAGTKIAKARVRVAEENYRLTESRIILAVKEAFFEILQKQEQITLAENIFERRKEDIVIIKLKYDAGRENLPAVKEAKANLSQAEYDKMKAEDELSLANAELNLLLNRPRKKKISIKCRNKTLEFPPLDSLIGEAKTERPEICAEKANRDMLEAQVSQAKSNYFPTLSLSSSYGWRGNEFLEQKNDWSAGISLSFPIFDGFSTRANVKEAALSLKEEEIKLKELGVQIEKEVEQAWVNWKLAAKKLEVCDEILKAAREMYQLTKLQYEQGRTSYFFLQQKENALTQAEYNYANALFNLHITGARLEKVWGRRES